MCKAKAAICAVAMANNLSDDVYPIRQKLVFQYETLKPRCFAHAHDWMAFP